MTSIPEPDRFVDAMRQSQEAAVKAFESWTRTMQQPFGQASGAMPTPGMVDLNPIVDQLFDFADATLQLQRQLAKGLLWASTQAVQAAQPRSGDEEVMEGG
jgi:hypothetical protein